MKIIKLVTHRNFTTIITTLIMALASAPAALAQPASTNLQGYGLKIFRVESGLYPFVQVYFRTFDQDMRPLRNLNELNVGIMVQGRVYDVEKKQYFVQSIRNRNEAVRSVFILDTSKTMAGAPFEEALRAAARLIDAKRRQDQVAIIALRDNTDGYEIVSYFERDAAALGRRLVDLKANGKQTRLYDSVAAAMQMGATADQGGINSEDAQYIASTSIIVFSDGKDEGSAISRSDLMTRITTLAVPIPIYSLAYSKVEPRFLKNLQALSKNSFGRYFHIGEALNEMTRSIERIQDILQNDYVVTFRAYIPVDGNAHNLKLGIEYPSRSGRFRYENAKFESIDLPVANITAIKKELAGKIATLPDANPYRTSSNRAVGAGSTK